MQELDKSVFRVYYEDTDAGGVVQHAAYVRFLERARTEKLRRLGWQQRALATKEGILFAVRRLSVEYLAPAFLDDNLTVTATPVKVGASSCLFSQKIFCDDKAIITAEVLVVCVRANPLRAVKIPAVLANALRKA